ncbi:MAG: TetR/AcrR family transcriptional regulator [Thermoleophilaceae bacterium]
MVEQVQRDRLCDAVVEAVADNGYRATTVREVLTRAKISRRTFYELYAGLDDCFVNAYEQAADDALTTVAAGCASAGSPERRVEAGLRALLDSYAREPQLARACVVEVLAAGDAVRVCREETMRRLAVLLAEALEGRRAGERSSYLRARVLAGGIHELIYDSVARGDFDRLPDLAGEVTASFELDRGRGPRA